MKLFRSVAGIACVALMLDACVAKDGGSGGSKPRPTAAPGVQPTATPEGEDPNDVTEPATGTLNFSVDAAFPLGLAIRPPSSQLLTETPVAPVVANTLILDSVVALVRNLLEADLPPMGDPCASLDENIPHEPGSQNLTDKTYIQCLMRESYTQRLERQKMLLAGDAEQCFRRRWLVFAVPEPPVSCANGGRMYSMNDPDGNRRPVSEPGGQVCGVRVAQEQIATVSAVLESATRLSLAALCQAKKDGVDLPLPHKEGESLNLKAFLEKAFEAAGETSAVQQASITYLYDVDNRPVVRTDIEISDLKDRPQVGRYAMHLVHVPPAAESADYHGVLWTSAGPANSTLSSYYGVSYSQQGATADDVRLKFEVRAVGGLDEPSHTPDFFIGDDGKLDMNAGVPASRWEPSPDNQCGHGWADTFGKHPDGFVFQSGSGLVRGDVNPWTQEGEFSINQNPGSGYFERSFSVHYSMQKADNGRLKGCANVGSVEKLNGPANSSFPEDGCLLQWPVSLRRILRTGMDSYPNGSRYELNGSEEMAFKVYRQCFRQNEGGMFELDDSVMTPQQISEGFVFDDVDAIPLINVKPPNIPTLPGKVKPAPQEE